MPRFSAFTPFGAFRFSSAPSEVEKIYRVLLGNLGGNYATGQGSRMDAWCYATARRLANVRLTLQHAGLQIYPPIVFEMMGERESEWQIVPGPKDGMLARRATLAARELLSKGARREAIVDVLSTLLGGVFLWYRTTKPNEIVTWPLALGDQPQNLQLPTVERKQLIITQPITFGFGAPQAVTYVMVNAQQPALLKYDRLVVQGENLARAETVTVTAVTPTTFTAVFNGVHDNRCSGSTMPFPVWVSNQRENLIIVAPAGAIDPETRRKINDAMERALRGVSTWAIVATTGLNTAGPFQVGVSPLGATPFGTVTFP